MLKIDKQLIKKNLTFKFVLEVIERHLDKKDREFYSNLREHLTAIFKMDPTPLMNYLAQPNLELNSDHPFIKEVNYAKDKYGFFFKESIERMKNPFLLSFAETNVEPGNSIHKLTFKRADETALDCMFTPGSMMPVLTLLTNSTKHSIQNGVYQLNEENIQSYIHETEQLTLLLKSLIPKKED